MTVNFSNSLYVSHCYKWVILLIAFLFLHNIIKSSPQNNFSKDTCLNVDSLIKKAENLYSAGNLDSAQQISFRILKTCYNLNDVLSGKLNNLLGNIQEDQGNYNKALNYYNLAINLFKRSNNIKGLSTALNNNGNIYYRWGQYEKAILFQKQALQYRKLINDQSGIASSYNNMGNIYYSWKKYEKALNYYKQAYELKLLLKDSLDLLNIQINIGSAWLGVGNLKEAELNYQKAWQLAKNNIVLQTDCQINIGYIRFCEKKYSEAIQIFKSALKASNKNELFLEKVMLNKNLAETYFEIDSIPIALKYYNTSMELAKKNNLTEIKLDLMLLKISYLEKTNKIKEAYYLQKEYHSLYDSIFNESSMRQVMDLQSAQKIESQIKEIQIRDLNLSLRDKEISNLRLIFTLSSILIIGIIIFFFVFFKYREKKSELKNEIIINSTMQKALAAQMNPHFISNSLNSIQKFFLENDVDAASTYLNNFGNMIRTVLNSSMSEYITFEEEIQILKLYTELEAMRLNKNIELIIDHTDDLKLEKIKIPPLLLQPVIENAIWHGIAHNNENGKITIKIQHKGNSLICEIDDNGVGRDKSREINAAMYKANRKSYGLKLVEDRLKIMYRNKKQVNLITIDNIISDKKTVLGTKVILTIPEL